MTGLPLVTVLVPARNEEADIEDCLRAVLDQDYPRDRLEVVVVDGDSGDRTVELAGKLLIAADVEHRVLRNEEATTPSNLNVGLAEARGEIVCRVDARSIVPRHYVRRCVEVLGSRPDVAVVGGSQVATARGDDAVALGIARALNNRFGMGLSRYRTRARSGPSDTVYLGAFRTAELEAVGGWDRRFETNQDFELNRRMSQLGLVWFDSDLSVAYRPRRSLVELADQYRRFGSWKVRYWRMTGERPRPRQVAMLAAPLVAAATAVSLPAAPRRVRLPVVAGAVAALVVVEVEGPTGPPAPLAAHLVSIVASGTIAAAWSTGVWRELLRGETG